MEHNVMTSIFRMRRVMQTDLETLNKAAAEDNHGVYVPTHVGLKNNEIVSYMSIGAMPLLLSWQHTQKMKARDSVAALAFAEDTMRNQGATMMCVPCDPKSPYLPYMTEFGYTEFPSAVKLFVKTLG